MGRNIPELIPRSLACHHWVVVLPTPPATMHATFKLPSKVGLLQRPTSENKLQKRFL